MKPTISLVFLVCLIIFSDCQSKNHGTYNLLIGTYTDTINSDGIYVYDFDSRTGDFSFKSKVADVENPSYLAISRDGKYVYAVNEVSDGGISSFEFNATSGELTFLNHVSSGGNRPAYISVDDRNEFVFVTNYGSGSLSAVSLKDDGSLSTYIQTIQHEGSSINARRQSGPHVHCAILSPNNKFLLSADLGTDKVNIYRFDPAKVSQPLIPAEPDFISDKPGNGPRHILFHPNSKFVYLISEMVGTITAFDYKDGNLSEIQMITMLSPDYNGNASAADIHISPDGRFLYGSNRGNANEIVIYSIDKDGKLSFVSRQSTLGERPRNFVIDPEGKFLLVGNQDSDEIIIFERDQETGLLTPTGKKIQVSKPVCLKFVRH